MPIEFCFVPHDEDQDREFEHTLIEPGDGVWFENYASGEREIIGLICGNDDTHGYMVFPDIDPDTNLDSMKTEIASGELPEFPGTVCLEEQSPPMDVDFDDGEGGKGTLRVRFVGNTALTCSLSIPKTLLHPN